MSKFIAIIFFFSDYTISNPPVFLEEITLVNVVSGKRKVPHEVVNKWIFQFGQSQNDVSAGSSYQVLRVVKKSDGLVEEREGRVSLNPKINTSLKKRWRLLLVIFLESTLRKFM